jgi:hypothetical protein
MVEPESPYVDESLNTPTVADVPFSREPDWKIVEEALRT